MRATAVATAMCFSAISLAAAPDVQAAIRKSTSIPAQGLGPALQTLAKEYAFQLVYRPEFVRDRQTAGATGELTATEALSRLLSGTGLTYRYLDDKTITIVPLPISSGDVAASAAPLGTQPFSANLEEREQPKRKKGFFERFRLAQADRATSSESHSVEAATVGNAQKRIELEEIVVTGSRIARRGAEEGPQDVKVFTRQQIDRSGQNSIVGFLQNLSESSFQVGPGAGQTAAGASAVVLRGLPTGSTLVLINGRRVLATSGLNSDTHVFDLNTIPLAAVERVEVLAEAGSSVYGSDALGGVVNIILRSDFEGAEGTVRYGAASGTDETNANFAWGTRWERGSFSVIGSYKHITELSSDERDITSTNDFRRFGGTDTFNHEQTCNPGNVFSTDGSNLPGLSSPFAAVPAGSSGTATVASFIPTQGTLNECGAVYPYLTLIPSAETYGIFASGTFSLSESMQAFAEFMWTSTDTFSASGTPPNANRVLVPATNPFNPFGVDVLASYRFTDLPRIGFRDQSDFFRPLLGLKGKLPGGWDFELAGWQSRQKEDAPLINRRSSAALNNLLSSTDPATALNLFTAASPAALSVQRRMLFTSPQHFDSKSSSGNVIFRGPLLRLPAGSVQAAFGADYTREFLQTNRFFTTPNGGNERDSYGQFVELRIPLLSQPERNDVLALAVAGRNDHFDGFGDELTGQAGLEWRPLDSLLVRASYGTAFKAPVLYELYLQQDLSPPFFMFDPQRNNEPVDPNLLILTGGNPDLEPETGKSSSVGIRWTAEVAGGLNLTLTQWNVEMDNRVTGVFAQILVDNEQLFPGRVTRAPSPGPLPGVITGIDATTLNFGKANISGVDLNAEITMSSRLGQWTPRLSVTNTYKYRTALVPGAPQVDVVSRAKGPNLGYAPRWKGSVGSQWQWGAFASDVGVRYLGRYIDYDGVHRLGGDTYVDVNFRYQFERAPSVLSQAELSIGAVNLFDNLPSYSRTYGFDIYGYDPNQSDTRGRFIYGQLSLRW